MAQGVIAARIAMQGLIPEEEIMSRFIDMSALLLTTGAIFIFAPAIGRFAGAMHW